MLYQLLLPPLISLGLIFIQWFLWGRDNYETIPVLYAPPENLSILESGILIDDAVNTKDVALEVYNLYLRDILIEKEPGYFSLNPGLKLETVDALSPCQKFILSELGANFDNITSIKRLSAKMKLLKIELYELMTRDGYFAMSPFDQRKPYFAIGSIFFAGPLLVYFASAFEESGALISWALTTGLSIAGLLFAYSSLFMVRKTEKGSKAKAQILGLKEFIQTAEIDRIKYVIQNDINAYRKLLPYAALFNELERWLKPLESMEQSLDLPQFHGIKESASAMDVDLSITERSHWLRALLDLFFYGTSLLSKLNRKRRWEDENTSSFDGTF